MRTLKNTTPDTVGGKELKNSLGFAFRLRIAVPDYEVAGRFWSRHHYESSALLDKDLFFVAFPDGSAGGWGLAYGANQADSSNAGFYIIKHEVPNEPAGIEEGTGACCRSLEASKEFWIPLYRPGPPAFTAWLRLTARGWNQTERPTGVTRKTGYYMYRQILRV